MGYYLFFINLITMGCFGIDKFKAMNKSWRIPEKHLLILTLCGGSIGAILGMILFNHKVKKPIFKWGIPLIMIGQIVLIWIYFHV